MGDCGVCLSEYDGDMAEFYSDREVVARKVHTCCECQRPIALGTTHHVVVGKWEGHFETYRTCPDCQDIRSALACGGAGPAFTCLWEDAEAVVFEHLTTACLNELATASAKAYLLERWNAWKFAA